MTRLTFFARSSSGCGAAEERISLAFDEGLHVTAALGVVIQ
jgi:hypothetical protein